MEAREKSYQMVNRIFCCFVILLSVGMLAVYAGQKNYYFCALSIVSPFYFLLPTIVQRLFRVPMLHQLNFVIFLFCFFAYTVGTAMGVYRGVPNYDKVMHTFSGVIFAFIGVILFHTLKPDHQIDKREYKIAAFFSFAFSMTIAALWEIYEYILDYFTGMDAQMVQATGIHDTMQDILVCLIGTVFFQIFIYRYYKKGRKGLFMGICDSMFG